MSELLVKSEHQDVKMETDQQGIKMEAKQQAVSTEAEHQGLKMEGEKQVIKMDEVTTVPNEPFPFMRLPPEIRNMVYKELLVVPGIICIHRDSDVEAGLTRVQESVRSKDGMGKSVRIDGKSIRQLLWTSKTIYKEASTFYFGSNHFRFASLDMLTECLQHIKLDFRRLLRRITVPFWGLAPAKGMKALATCVSLSELTLGISWYTSRYLRGDQNLMKPNGLNDLLKIRGLEKVTLDIEDIKYFHDLDISNFFDKDTLANALQILKEPHDPAKLKRQEAKDYPNRKSQRTVFGKANVMTRTESMISDEKKNP